MTVDGGLRMENHDGKTRMENLDKKERVIECVIQDDRKLSSQW